MFIIKGERYYNDYIRENFTKTFSSLDDIFEWLKEKSGNFNGTWGNYFPSVRRFDKADKDGNNVDVGNISINDYENRGWEYWIYEIKTNEGIVFANGRTTNRHKFCAKKVEEWLKDSERKMKEIQNKPNFVEI